MTLPPLLDEGGAFVLVGVGHLPGRDGLIELLRARGYTVTPVTLPAGRGT
ncbi:TraB/GumN family protein [Paraburkholderia youngii]